MKVRNIISHGSVAARLTRGEIFTDDSVARLLLVSTFNDLISFHL